MIVRNSPSPAPSCRALQIEPPSAVCHCFPASSLLSRLCDSPFLPHLVTRGLVNGAAKVDVRASLCACGS